MMQALPSEIAVARDYRKGRTKYGDINLCLCTHFHQPDVIRCRVEVKAVGHSAKDRKNSCSILTKQCLEFFKQKAKYPYLDLVIFISWINFTEWLKSGYQTSKKIKLLTILANPDSGCIVIDDLENMKEKTILNFNAILARA